MDAPTVDPAYEYEAPQYLDFENDLQNDDPNVDQWFDHRRGTVAPADMLAADEDDFLGDEEEPAMSDEEQQDEEPEQQQENEAPQTNEAEEEEASSEVMAESNEADEKPKKRNLVASWGANVVKKMQGKTLSAANPRPKRVAEEPAPPKRAGSVHRKPSINNKAEVVPTTRVAPPPARTGSVKRTPSVKRTAPKAAATPTAEAGADTEAPKRITRSASRRVKPPTPSQAAEKKPERSGSIKSRPPLRRAGSSSKLEVKSSEEIELEKIEALRKEAALQRKKSRSSFKRLARSTDYVPVRSTKPLTTPQGFEFQTDRFHGKKDESTTEEAEPVKRQAPAPMRITKPQPFKFAERSRDKPAAQQAGQPYIPVAQQVEKFVSKTPERFRKRAQKEDHYQAHQPGSRPASASKLTVPQSPKLSANKRKRSNSVLSSEQLEAKMLEEMKPFKATPLNPEIMNSRGDYGVPRIEKKDTTVPKAFDFRIEQRLATRPAKQEEEEAPKPFVARPAPSYEAVFGKQPQKKQRTATVPEPFEVEKRSQQMEEAKRRRIEAALEAERAARQFKANPLPSLSPEAIAVQHKPPTVPEPFSLKSVELHEQSRQRFEMRLREEEQETVAKRQFVAQPPEVLEKAPFLPAKSHKPLTEVHNVVLNSDVRASHREIFDKARLARLESLEEERQQMELAKQEEEERMVQDLRKQAVHKANPIRNFSGVEIHPSTKKLTEPNSPMWAQKRASLRS